MIDFVHQHDGHRCLFTYGTGLAANFVGESKILRFKDNVLLRNESGRVGIWNMYSVIYSAPGKFRAIGRLVGFQDDYDKGLSRERGVRAMEIVGGAGEGAVSQGSGAGTPKPRILGLLAEGSGS